uniref:Uncharacterized protein n=1 Tax=Oncorhynchus tshawytscha TaxID=74940 RepID=A0A8C8GY66_ONCTS
MDFDLPPGFTASGIAWERVLPPLLPGLNGTFGLYSFTPSELLTLVTEHTGPAQVKSNQIKSNQILFVTYTWLADVNASVANQIYFICHIHMVSRC